MEKIALFIPTLQGGGAERAMVNLASGLVSLGYNVDLVVVNAQGVFYSQVNPSVRVIDFKQPRVLFSLLKLITYLIKEKPVGLISALDYANVIALIGGRLSQIPVIISEHSTHSIAHANTVGLRAWLLPSLIRNTYPLAHMIVAVSSGVADNLSSALNLPINRIKVIANPVISTDLLFKDATIPKHPWIINKTVPVILAIGRLTVPKDFPTLLNAFAITIRSHNAKLIILGEGEERAHLEELIKNLNLSHAVSLPGFSNTPYSYLTNSDLFVLSSIWEGLPTVLIEALACGCPVVSTDCPSGPREILENGRWGRLIPPKDSKALANAMIAELISPSPKPTNKDLEQYTIPFASRCYASLLNPK